MNRRKSLAVLTGLGGALVLEPSTAFAKKEGGGAIPAAITGQLLDPKTGAVIGQLAGTLAITSFSVQNNALVAIGSITAEVTDLLGNIIKKVKDLIVTLTGIVSQSSCTILTLTLGPLDLNILGLMIHLNRVVLTITGDGGLLGQLLCSISNALNNLLTLVTLLNTLLQLFGSV